MIRLFAASRFCLLIVNISEANDRRFDCAPLVARSVATFSIALVIVSMTTLVNSVALVVSGAVIASARLALSIATFEAPKAAPASEVATSRVAVCPAPANSETPLNCCDDSDPSCSASCLNSVL